MHKCSSMHKCSAGVHAADSSGVPDKHVRMHCAHKHDLSTVSSMCFQRQKPAQIHEHDNDRAGGIFTSDGDAEVLLQALQHATLNSMHLTEAHHPSSRSRCDLHHSDKVVTVTHCFCTHLTQDLHSCGCTSGCQATTHADQSAPAQH